LSSVGTRVSLLSFVLTACVGSALGLPRVAEAQEPSPTSEESKAAAHAHFDKGLAASNDQRFGEAAVEFEKAYELWPDFRVLYNIGKVRATLGRFAEAVAAFEAYLDKGGDGIPPQRKQEVLDAIATQMAHVATVTVRVSPDGAEVRVDGKLVGLSPLAAPVRVTEGKHTVEALLPGRPAQLRELDTPGASTVDVALDFPIAANLAAPAPAATAPALVEKPERREPPRRSRAVGFGVAATGLVSTLVGSVLAYQGATDANAARARLVQAAMPAPPGTPDVMTYDAAKRSFDDAKTRNQLGWALVGFGAAALVAGGALVLVWSGSSGGIGGTW
jgi:tetratricopeptide (TPR) repeat protein